ncbi:MAG: ribbon-helix-helix protein, CopG family [Elusimicrobia bacterium]|nr:ribbon-helix-helix protein, CopG family [Candidatus Obscuribacterium magneticum]MCB4756353.1 ribbon-helix-helix protein, CopG family [Candidatus Obscuribacterium magneticum]
MARMIKTAVSIPKEDFKIVESLRKKTGKTRSQIIVEAFHSWLREIRMKELDDQYEEGYRKQPEDPREVEAFFKVGLETWGKEKW